MSANPGWTCSPARLSPTSQRIWLESLAIRQVCNRACVRSVMSDTTVVRTAPGQEALQPDAPRILSNTKNIERGRFRFADGRIDRSGLNAAGHSCRNVAATEPSNT